MTETGSDKNDERPAPYAALWLLILALAWLMLYGPATFDYDVTAVDPLRPVATRGCP